MDVEKKVIQSYENVLEIRYEDLLTSPAVVLKDIWNYIGKETDEELLREIETMVDYSRAFAYKQNEELSVFAQENKSILEKFGYSA